MTEPWNKNQSILIKLKSLEGFTSVGDSVELLKPPLDLVAKHMNNVHKKVLEIIKDLEDEKDTLE